MLVMMSCSTAPTEPKATGSTAGKKLTAKIHDSGYFEPIRNLGKHAARVRLTIDLIPEIAVIVHREGEAVLLEQEEALEEELQEAPETASEPQPVAEPVSALPSEAPAEEETEAA